MTKEIKPTKHWLFDFDGTLVDSMGYWAEAMVGVLDDHGVKYSKDVVSIITPLGTHGTAEYFKSIGLNVSLEQIGKEIFSKLTPLYRDVIVEKEGVRECLAEMKKSGYKLHVLTASPHAWLDPCLERIGLSGFFENIWSCDDFGTTKTNPDIYTAAAERVGTQISDITFLDDNINADKAAKLSGVRVIGVYDKSSEKDAEEMKVLTDGYIYSFSELQAAICK